MANYKNIKFSEQLVGMVRYMPTVEDCRVELNHLQATWDNLTLLGQLSGTGSDMQSTRQSFQQLTGSLLNQLAAETLHKTLGEMQSKAQVAIDILVRNLFERTADIGFLATDADIIELLKKAKNLKGQYCRKTAMEADLSRLSARFREYVAKYSVYADIVLFDAEGELVLRLNEQASVERTQHPLFKLALETTEAYVETFDKIDFLPKDACALVYSFRVNGEDDTALGVLSLCFRFENEMLGIFNDLVAENDWSVITLLNRSGQVIASSDRYHIPPGAILKPVLNEPYQIQRFAGQEYLALTQRSGGYQGYAGPDWFAHIMLPLQQAFNHSSTTSTEQVPPKVLENVMAESQLFSAALRSIPVQAERIQRTLNRSVWNGNIRQYRTTEGKDNGFSKVLLWEISNTGARTQAVFQHSIDNLHATVVSSVLANSHFQASLAINIMDRNLYERANDCRWWALTATFRNLLSAPQLSSEDQSTITHILAYINSLYTVYTNLIVFDRHGLIVAVSNPQELALVGQAVGEEWARRALALTSTQGYVVSDFVETRFYQNRPTYIYGAAIRGVDDDNVVGGIGIVFDAAPQFSAMLRDAIPALPPENSDDSLFAAFVSRAGRVIACSDDRFVPGDEFPVASVVSGMPAGEGKSCVFGMVNQYTAFGAHASSGYREYKGSDDHYRNDVIAVVGKPLCPIVEQHNDIQIVSCPAIRSERSQNGSSEEIATFRLGIEWFGIRANQILEAVDATHITPAPGAGVECIGYLAYEQIPIPVFDIRTLICFAENQVTPDNRKSQQVMILEKNAETRYGIIADCLGDIPEVAEARLAGLPTFIAGGALLADAAIAPDQPETENLLLVLSSERLAQKLAASFGERSLEAVTQFKHPSIVESESKQKIG